MHILRPIAKKIPHRIAVNKRDNSILENSKEFIAQNSSILDVGCGKGRLSEKIMNKFKSQVKGLEVIKFENSKIDIDLFNGKDIPHKKNSFDYVFMADILHHTPHAEKLITQSLSIANKGLIIKDHYYNSNLGKKWLKLADNIGNIADGVPIYGNYYSLDYWTNLAKQYDGHMKTWNEHLIHQIMIYLPVN